MTKKEQKKQYQTQYDIEKVYRIISGTYIKTLEENRGHLWTEEELLDILKPAIIFRS